MIAVIAAVVMVKVAAVVVKLTVVVVISPGLVGIVG